jgi:hypothetical protein
MTDKLNQLIIYFVRENDTPVCYYNILNNKVNRLFRL